MEFNPKDYWEERLSKKYNLSGVGHAEFSKYYNSWLYKAKIRTFKKALLSYKIAIEGISVCDIGCGTGFFIDIYHNYGAKKIVGIDITDTSITILSGKYPQYKFINDSISSYEILSKINTKFDIVNVFDVLYHIIDDNKFINAIYNICDLTRDSGYIFITDNIMVNGIQTAKHVKFRNIDIYKKLFLIKKIEFINILPLYFLLNNKLFGHLYQKGLLLDNLLAPLYYIIDNIFINHNLFNMGLIIGRKL